MVKIAKYEKSLFAIRQKSSGICCTNVDSAIDRIVIFAADRLKKQ